VAVGVFVSFSEVAFFNPVLGVFIPEFEREFGWSRTQISLGVSLGSLVGAAFAPFFGPMIDRVGGRRFVAGGATLMTVGLVLMSQMQESWQFFIIYALGRGTASGLLGLAAGVTVAKWFVRRRGHAIGVMTLGTRMGHAVLPLSVQLIIQASGWRTAALSLAAVVGVLGILPALKWLHGRPEDHGLQPDGDGPDPDDDDPAFDQTRPNGRTREYSWSRHDAMRTQAFYMVTLAVSLMSLAGGAINLHQIPHLVDRGLSPETAALVITLFAIFGGVGVLGEGVFDERLGARWTMVIGLLGSAFGMVFLMAVHTVAMAIAFSAVYGLAFGLMVASNQVVFAEYFGRESLGAIRGAAIPAQLGMNALGPIIAGGAYDLTGSYMAAFVPFTLFYVLAAIGLVLARKPVPPGATALSSQHSVVSNRADQVSRNG
jgi:OFA family oxalate/formate antiporter-like MFS transporter